MSPVYDPEHVVEAPLARTLIGRQFPALRIRSLEPFGAGWDNTAYLVHAGGEARPLVFRFPRREIAVPAMETELRVLPELEGRLPIATPCPSYGGHPDLGYPWPFAGYPLLHGRTACAYEWSDTDRLALAEPMARVLRTLHDLLRCDAPPELRSAVPGDTPSKPQGTNRGDTPSKLQSKVPGDRLRRVDLDHRLGRVHEHLAPLAALPFPVDVDRARAIVAEIERRRAELQPDFYATESHRGPALVHGDLYARHLLVDDQRVLCGIIDWGDLHLGHPATDLHILYSFFGRPERDAFLEVYGPIDEQTKALARFRALYHSSYVATYASEIGDADLLRAGRQALSHSLEED